MLDSISESCDARAVSFVAATANVTTLSPGKKFIANSKIVPLIGRTQLLEMAFDASKLDIIGVQECRIPSDQRISGIVYEMLVASCNEGGQYGVQLWVRRSPNLLIQSWMPRSPRLEGSYCA